jgi:2-polyprenyl-3-methyl-5-hydroxy-6-metoxy-1,4-benzoquinol methylase
MSLRDQYYARPAAAWVRGQVHEDGELPSDPEALERVLERGVAAGLASALHAFKRTAGLPRVTRALGIMRALAPRELLDIGAGRGAFLWPLCDMLSDLAVTVIDRERHALPRVELARCGGLRVRALQADATELPFANGAFEVVTALEVLEHIPEVWRAAVELVRVARRFVVVSVPSRDDDNPQHLRLLREPQLSELFHQAGAADLRCEHVLNHLVAVIKVG